MHLFQNYLNTHVIPGNRPLILNNNMTHNERDYVIKNSINCGAYTLMLSSYGRGTDFVCLSSDLNNKGGVHIIQTFFSETKVEEIQIMGRTCRQSDPGSYRLILHLDDLDLFNIKSIFEINSSANEIDHYLNLKRN